MSSFEINDPPKVRSANAPEKIYGWLNSQLSIARFYGGITFNGKKYVVDFDDPKEPLVREDVFKKEKKAKK